MMHLLPVRPISKVGLKIHALPVPLQNSIFLKSEENDTDKLQKNTHS